MSKTVSVAKLLGWTSFAVGAVELLATKPLQEAMGVRDDHSKLLRTFGIRECVAGATILNQPGLNKEMVAGLWSRVAGDAADLALLAAATPTTRKPKGLATIIAIVVAVTGLDIFVATCAQIELKHGMTLSQRARRRVVASDAVPVKATVDSTIAEAVQ